MFVKKNIQQLSKLDMLKKQKVSNFETIRN